MSDRAELHVIPRGRLLAGSAYDDWDDPDQLATLTPGTLEALRHNPFAGDDDQPAQIIGVLGRRIIGRLDLIPGRIDAFGEPVPVLHLSHLVVIEAHRSTLLGALLVIKSQGLNANLSAFGPTRRALQLYEKLRWTDLPLRRFVFARRSRAVVERYVPWLWARPLARAGVDAALTVARAGLALVVSWRTRRLKCSQADSVPPELADRLASPPRPVSCHRSGAFLDWCLTHSFNDEARRGRRLYVIHGPGGRLVGYFIIKTRFYPVATPQEFRDILLGTLADWRVFEPEHLSNSDVVLLASDAVLRSGADMVEICMTEPEIPRSLRALGFLPAGTMHMLFRADPASPLARPEARSVENWMVRQGDGDNLLW